ncbi:MAG: hypothetical protein Q8N37_04260 [bacterium]|nr:hypothetical protein [bacterium]
MEIKTDLNVKGLIKALKEHGIVVSKGKNGIEIDSSGVFLEGVLPPGETGKRKRIIRFFERGDESIDPSFYGFMAYLAKKGPKIIIRPLPKKNPETVKSLLLFGQVATF